MGRSLWKFKFISKCDISRILGISLGKSLKRKKFNIFKKSSTITDVFIKNSFYLHTGKVYRRFMPYRLHVGFKFGDFVLTRKIHIFKKILKKNKR